MRFSGRILPGTINVLGALLDDKRRTGAPVHDLTVSNPTCADLPYPEAEILAALADPAALVHEPAPLGLPAARAAVAADLGRRGHAVDPADVVLTASTSEAYALLFKLLCDPGDEVLAAAPSYPLFDHLASLEGVTLAHHALAWDGDWHIDFSALEAAITPRTRALLVVSPGNPTGAYLKEAELARLDGYGLPLIVDEVFAEYPSPLAPRDRVDFAAGRDAAVPIFSLGGLSKSAGLPQLKLAWIVMNRAARAARDALETISDAYLSVGAPVMHAAARLLVAGAGVRAALQQRLAAARALLDASPLEVLPSEGGWSAILRVPRVKQADSDEAWALALLGRHDVLVHPGYYFDFPGSGAHLVVSLLSAPADLQRGVEAILELCPKPSASR